MRVLFSVHPEYADMIINGTKRYEFRRRLPARSCCDCFALYSTLPVGGVVAQGRIERMLSLPPDDLWRLAGPYSGLRRASFEEYFEGASMAHAIELCDVVGFDEMIPLSQYAPRLKRPPQSFAYV